MIPIPALVALGSKLLDRAIPDPAARDAAKAELAKQAAAGALAELQHEKDIFGLEVEDKKSARQMAMTVGIMPQLILGSIITLGFFGMAGIVFFVDIPPDKKDIVLFMFGVLATAWTGGVVGFFFGSSHGSKEKSAAFNKLSEKE